MTGRAYTPLTGRTALVTGAGSGIGRGITLALARRGVQVGLVGRREGPLATVAHEVAALGGRAVAFPSDLTRADARSTLYNHVHGSLGPIDLLVNNAGVLAGGELSTLSLAEIETAITVNLLAPMALVRQFLPDLAARRGAVILVGSMMSFVPLPAASVYSATKTGLRAFGEAVRYELQAYGVHLLIAYPPGTATAVTAAMAHNAPWQTPLADPIAVGERIVQALLSGRREIQWGMGERILTILYQTVPWLVRSVLAHQRPAFVRMMTEDHHD